MRIVWAALMCLVVAVATAIYATPLLRDVCADLGGTMTGDICILKVTQ